MILHIPHASDVIPAALRDQFVLSDAALANELRLMTDAFTDELFAYPGGLSVRFPYSRLLTDAERFPDDEQEPMSRVGMGRFYMKTADGKPLRRALNRDEIELLDRYYSEHHQKLTDAVESELKDKGQALIIDCHSFPSIPLPCDQNQTQPRPDFCIGTDPFHTPTELVDALYASLSGKGFSTAVNRPYSGTLVPLAYYGKDRRVSTIMIEVNRSLYMDETTGAKYAGFDKTAHMITKLLNRLMGD